LFSQIHLGVYFGLFAGSALQALVFFAFGFEFFPIYRHWRSQDISAASRFAGKP